MRIMQNFENPVTGETFYEPIKLNYVYLFIRISAWVRIFFYGFCPNCNSSAPKIDRCNICEWDTNSPFNSVKRKRFWNKWKLYDFKGFSMRKLEEY